MVEKSEKMAGGKSGKQSESSGVIAKEGRRRGVNREERIEKG